MALYDGHEGTIKKRRGANLPHWTAERAIYFVTFRLGDSLPQGVVAAYREERERLLALYRENQGRVLVAGEVWGARSLDEHWRDANATEADGHRRDADATDAVEFTRGDLLRLRELFAEKIERCLDAGEGACWMGRPEIAEIVANAIRYFDQERYALHAWCVMPNHVHVVVQPTSHSLSSIMHSWKSFTSKQANKRLGRTGEFWQAESYDHLIRDAQDYCHCVGYTLDNPLRAGLMNWRWVGGSAEHRRDADATA